MIIWTHSEPTKTKPGSTSPATTTTTRNIYDDATSIDNFVRLPVPATVRHSVGAAGVWGEVRPRPRGDMDVTDKDKIDAEADASLALVALLLYVGRWIMGTIAVCLVILLASWIMQDKPSDYRGADEVGHYREGRMH